MLESKLSILKALNITGGDDDEKITLNVKGCNKSVVVDLKKLREAFTFQEGYIDEKSGKIEEKKDIMEDMNLATITEEEFVQKAVEKIGELQKTKNKTLAKDSFIKVFKMIGEFAKLRTRDIKKNGQSKRMENFGSDAQKYLKAMKDVIQEEETAYEESANIMYDKLCITPECFERTQQELMMDPYASMELFNMGIGMEQPTITPPEELNKEKTTQLVKDSN